MPTRPVLVESIRADLYRALEAERLRQLALGYDAQHDARHTAADWVCLIVRYVGVIPDDGVGVKDLGRAATHLVSAGALILAALERLAGAGVAVGVGLPEAAGAFEEKPVPVLAPEERSRIG